MIEGPFCTHQRVNLTPHIHEDGSCTDHWRCECGQVFMPVGSTLDTETERPVPRHSRGPQLWVWIGSDDDKLDVLRYVKATERDILRQSAVVALAEREANMNRAQQQASSAWLKAADEVIRLREILERIAAGIPHDPDMPGDWECAAVAKAALGKTS